MCRKIKERRARMQHAHMAPDYIPVGGGGADTLQDSLRSAAAKEGSGSDSEPEAGDNLRMSFLGDTKKRGKAAPGVFAQVAEEAQVHLLPAAQAGLCCHHDRRAEIRSNSRSASIRCGVQRLRQ